MSTDSAPPIGPDLRQGISRERLEPGEPFFGHVDDSPVYILLGKDGEIRAYSAVCTHYGGPLADGILVEDTIRCPWHHARFHLEDGSVERGPAFNPLARRSVTVEDGTVSVGDVVQEDPLTPRGRPPKSPESVVIVGAGAAGFTAAETLRREGYAGEIHLVDPDPDAPYDRPNLSKDYLAGDAPEEWIPLRPEGFLEEHGIKRVHSGVREVNLDEGWIVLDDDETLPYEALLLAPGAQARKLEIPGGDQDHVFTLRSLQNCRSIISRAEEVEEAVVIGSSFIGMEVAASLSARGLTVHVVSPDPVPFASILGRDLGSFVQAMHEEKGVQFHLENKVEKIDGKAVVLEDGTRLSADLVVAGVGVSPRVDLARRAGLEVDDGIVVDEGMRTSHPGVFAAGDAASYPEARHGKGVRVEHWVLAGWQGRVAALNMLGKDESFQAPPFFWTEHFGTPIAYVGYGRGWDEAIKKGKCDGDGCAVTFRENGELTARATIFQDRLSLETEAELESGGAAKVRLPQVDD